MVSIRVKTLSNTNLAALRHIKIEKGFLPVYMHHSTLIPTKFVRYLVYLQCIMTVIGPS